MTITSPKGADPNQFQEFITTCGDDPKRIQEAYETHRTNRNAKFRELLLSPSFREWTFDEYLENIKKAEKGLLQYEDPRHNLTIWTRPPRHIRELIYEIQQEIASVAGPCIWLMPPDNLHMTTSEMLSSCPGDEVDKMAAILQEKLPIEETMSYTLTHRARLIRPVISYDTTAFALSFVPAAEEETDAYTYHHLRRDIWDILSKSGCEFASRYNVPSAHLTIARFAVSPEADKSEMLDDLCNRTPAIVNKIEEINQTLQSKDWTEFGNPSRGEWVVGQERGLDFHKGRSWFGEGETVYIGKGI